MKKVFLKADKSAERVPESMADYIQNTFFKSWNHNCRNDR